MTTKIANKLCIVAGATILLAGSLGHALSPKEVYKKAGPAVVLILGSDDGKAGSAGTGSIITPEGKVVTNAHVVINHSGQPFKILYIFMKPRKLTGDNTKDLTNRYKAKVLSWSPAEELDLALLQIDSPPPDLPTISFGDPGEVEIGDDAITIGHPEQGGLWTLTTGAVSTMIANFSRVKGKHVFQTEASVNRGNSGGPLLDGDGNMIGINTCIARQGAGGVAITGVNFALKSSVAVEWLSGKGMGLAYAAPTEEEKVILAAPPDASQVKSGQEAGAKVATATDVEAGSTVKAQEKPPATIVVKQKPPKSAAEAKEKAAKLKTAGQSAGKGKAGEKLEGGERMDPAKAKPPQYHTEKRPMSLDDIRKAQMKELEDMMEEMSGKIKKKRGKGMGLW